MNPGRLRDRITIQSCTRTKQADGSFATAWSDLMTVWAEAGEMTGRDAMIASQLQVSAEKKFLIRKDLRLVQDIRVVHRGRTFYPSRPHVEVDRPPNMYVEIWVKEKTQ